MNAEKLRALALDLNRTAPRSPRAALANFPAVAARLVDKCRAELVGWNGAYHYNCPMDRKFFAACGLDAEALRPILEDEDPAHFHFEDAGLSWRDLRATTDEVAAARKRAVTSFGSCSFDEPREDLRTLGLLH